MRSPLYSPRAGFHPRGSTIRVWMPNDWVLHLNEAIAGWNHIAGRRLFVHVQSRDLAEITFHDPDEPGSGYPGGEYAVPINADGRFSKTDPYARCEIWMSAHGPSREGTTTAAHELGHCLGLRHRRIGIMSGAWFRIGSDRWMLQRAGYA